MSREEQLDFLESAITEILKLSLRANLRTLVYLLSIAKVAAAEARRGQAGDDKNGSFAPAQPS
jgi:hypothetical protein